MTKKRVFITGGKGDIARAIKMCLSGYKVLAPSHKNFDVTHPDYDMLNKFNPDFIINNAGFIKPCLLKDIDYDFVRHFTINTFYPIRLSQWAIKNGCLGVIHIGSSSIDAKNEWGPYCASKMALRVLSETLSIEGFPSVVISPGRTDTHMRNHLYPEENKSTLLEPLDVAIVARDVLSNIDVFDGKEILIKNIKGKIVRVIRKIGYNYEKINYY